MKNTGILLLFFFILTFLATPFVSLNAEEVTTTPFEESLPGGVTVEELQSRFGLSREGVRRIKRKAMRKLRDSGNLDKLKGYLDES